jgi:hypothetical protein
MEQGANADGAAAAASPLAERLVIVDDFLPATLAEAMRADIDAHFDRPDAHAAASHQVWNYWFVPELYTYLRTQPEKVIDPERVRGFFDHLRGWCAQALGLSNVTWPYLSLYVGGCRQGLHNDAGNGRFGFVYSLTRNDRATIGGQTVVHHAGDPVRAMLTRPGAGRAFYDLVEPRFNRLVLFDDRLPHAVERVDGSMDPREGRFVLHGHVSEGAPMAVGALSADAMTLPLTAALKAFERSVFMDGLHGPLVLRLTVRPDGVADACRIVLDRVLQAGPDDGRWPRLRADLVAAVLAVPFPAASAPTELLLPVSFGDPPVRAGA